MISSIVSEIDKTKFFFKDIILDTMVRFESNQIGWPNYSPGISRKLYSKEYEELKDNRQYSFLLENKGLIQFFYDFGNGGEHLIKSKLAYYPYPVKLREDFDDIDGYYSTTDDLTIGEFYYDLWKLFQSDMGKKVEDRDLDELKGILNKIGVSEYEILENKFDKKYDLTNTSHFRIDYDSNVISHHKCEVQYSSINKIRIPLKNLISPLIFMDFISKNEFPNLHKSLWSKNDYRTTFSVSIKHMLEIRNFEENNIFIQLNK